jgi:D-threo-aldose 1-dehydrogenase
MNQRYQPMTRLGLGGTGLGDMYHTTSDSAAQATVDAAWEAGIRYFDTAPHYGAGLSEHRFGSALRNRPRGEFTLSTKVGRLLLPASTGEIAAPFVSALPFRRMLDYTADGVRRALEDSLQRLALGHIDIAYVHDLSPDQFSRSDFEHHFGIAAGSKGAFAGLVKLREEGVIKAWGMGVNTVEPCLRALEVSDPDIFLLAGRYTLMETTPLAELFPLCAARGARVVLGGPFNSGFLAGGEHYDYAPASQEKRAQRERLRQVAARHGVDLVAAALQFGAAHPVVAATIPGASSPEHLRRNALMMGIAIPAAFWEELVAQGLLPPGAPLPRQASCQAPVAPTPALSSQETSSRKPIDQANSTERRRLLTGSANSAGLS